MKRLKDWSWAAIEFKKVHIYARSLPPAVLGILQAIEFSKDTVSGRSKVSI